MSGIVCAGNWILDIVHVIDRWPGESQLVTIGQEVEGIGGGAANVLLALQAMGVGVPLHAMGLLGRDAHGATCRGILAAAGADMGWLGASATARTAHTHVMTVAGQSRTFFYHPGCNDDLTEADLPVEEAAKAGAGLLYLGYLNLLGALDRVEAGTTGAARVLARARAAGMVTAADLVSRAHDGFAAVVAASAPQLDYLFANEVEAGLATGLPIAGPGDVAGLLAAGRALRALGARVVVLHTPEAGLWIGAAEVIRRPEPAAVVVNPLGAGDAFCAGVLWAVHEGWGPERALALGQRAATECLKGETAVGTIPRLPVLLAGL